jgi:hypothetical protein
MGKVVILPLNCSISYEEYNPKKDESYTDSFYIRLEKVSERAILIVRGDFLEGRDIYRCWLPKRFIRQVFKRKIEKGEGWFIEVDFSGYCQYREQLAGKGKSIKGLCGCAYLDQDGYMSGKGIIYPLYDEKPFEEINQVEEDEEDWDLPIPKTIPKEKPKAIKELEKLLTEFGIKE